MAGNSTLVLNADGNPMGLLPVSTKSWSKAIEHVWSNKAQVLHTYEDWVVHSPSIAMSVPAVILMNEFAKPKHSFRFSPYMVKLRDRFTCQYCGEGFPPGQLTMDHVHPASFGGGKSWENIVAACQPCNGLRGNNTKIRPMKMPYRPSYWELVAKSREYPIKIPHRSWAYYIGWSEELIGFPAR